MQRARLKRKLKSYTVEGEECTSRYTRYIPALLEDLLQHLFLTRSLPAFS